LDVFCTVIASMSPQKICGSIAVEIPILWPGAVMVGPRPHVLLTPPLSKGEGKAVPLQAWSGPEGSRKIRFPDFMTTA